MEQWIEDVVFENKYYSDSDIKYLFENEIKNKFHFQWDGENIVHNISILPQYQYIIERYHISEADIKNNNYIYSLCFFPGHDEEIENWIINENIKLETNYSNSGDDALIVPIIVENKPVQLVQKNKLNLNNSNYIGHIKKNISDNTKQKIGKLSEKLVFDSMIQNSNFKDVIGISRNLDPINGNDNAHYDITYKESCNLKTLRYLEVKTANYNNGHYTFLMSAHEYEFAINHIDNYDVALVINHNEIKICKSLFKDKTLPSVHTYEVCVNISKE